MPYLTNEKNPKATTKPRLYERHVDRPGAVVGVVGGQL